MPRRRPFGVATILWTRCYEIGQGLVGSSRNDTPLRGDLQRAQDDMDQQNLHYEPFEMDGVLGIAVPAPSEYHLWNRFRRLKVMSASHNWEPQAMYL